MSSNNNNFDFFNPAGEPFEGLSKQKTTDFDFFNSNGEVFPYLIQPAVVAAAPPPETPGFTPRRRIFFID